MILLGFLLSAEYCTCMEIVHEGKSVAQKFLLDKNREHNYCCVSNHSNGAQHSFMYSTVNLPHDSGVAIVSALFAVDRKDSEEKRKRLWNLNHALVLKLFMRAQLICPLKIGNKEFEWKDVIVLPKKNQDELFELGNPNVWYSYLTGFSNYVFDQPCRYYGNMQELVGEKKDALRILEAQPQHIKQGMIIRLGSYTDEKLYLKCVVFVAATCISGVVDLMGAYAGGEIWQVCTSVLLSILASYLDKRIHIGSGSSTTYAIDEGKLQ